RRAGPARVPRVPTLGLRERRARPGPAPSRTLLARGPGPRAGAAALHRLDGPGLAARYAAPGAPARAPARGALQARRGPRLGRRAALEAGRPGPRRRGRL